MWVYFITGKAAEVLKYGIAVAVNVGAGKAQREMTEALGLVG